MPIYEFSCCQCCHQFEALFLSADEPDPHCPQCGSEKVEKLMSAGAIRANGIPTGSGGFKPPKCAPAGG